MGLCIRQGEIRAHSEIRLALSTDGAGRPVRTRVNTDIGWFLRDAPLSPWPYERRSPCFSLHWVLCVCRPGICPPTFFQSLNCRHTEGHTLRRSREEGERRTASRGIGGGGVGTKCRTPQPQSISGDLHKREGKRNSLKWFGSMVNSYWYKIGQCNLLYVLIRILIYFTHSFKALFLLL